MQSPVLCVRKKLLKGFSLHSLLMIFQHYFMHNVTVTWTLRFNGCHYSELRSVGRSQPHMIA